MVEVHVLFTGSVSVTVRQLTDSQSFLDLLQQPGLNELVIHGEQNSLSELHVQLRMRSGEPGCGAADHVV